MPRVAIVTGLLLEVVGFGAFFLSGMKSYTALIPAVVGAFILVMGLLSRGFPEQRKHFMHVAALMGLLGLLGSARGLGQIPALLSGAEGVRPVAVWGQVATALVCAIFLGFCIKSFIAARKSGVG